MRGLSTTVRGGRFPRLFFLRAMLVFVACFGLSVFLDSTALAADATWTGDVLTYGGQTYQAVGQARANDPRNLPQGTKLYAYIENSGTENQRVNYITFPSDSTPNSAKTARHVSYKNHPSSGYTDKSNEITITVSNTPAEDEDTAPNEEEEEEEEAGTEKESTTSCDSRFTFGIGWIVCPVTNFLANAMDWLFEQLANFLVVRPVTTDAESPLYRAWQVMRNFANVAFVIAFMIVIYSQITTIGYSNYSIKRVLPRLVIAAILVNISYWICALAVDVSNVLGYSFHDVFVMIRESLVGEGNSWSVVSWKSITGAILAGGAATVGTGIFTYSIVAGSAGGALFLLLPILVSVIFAVLVALLVMVARQALITILIIISPLAFVAFILPNTEKYFEKWRSTFLTMLMLFPIFSVIFGGSQLAGMAIIQNADSINLIILGMAVQVAPVIITPMLVKFSGSLIGRLANIVNDPKRGLLDRTKNWSNERRDQHKARILAGRGRENTFNRATRNIDHKRRRREGWKAANESRAGYRFEDSKEGRRITMAGMETDADKKLTSAEMDKSFHRRVITDQNAIRRDIATRFAGDKSEQSKAVSDAMYSEARTGKYTYPIAASPEMDSRVADIHQTAQQTALDGTRKAMADRKFASDKAEILKANTPEAMAMRAYASGIMRDSGGMESVKATARSESSKFLVDDISNIEATTDNELATNHQWLLTELKRADLGLAERVAYSKMLSRSGSPGIQAVRKAITHFETANPSAADQIQDYKDFMRGTATFTGAGKDLEFWANNSTDSATGAIRSFDQITKDAGTWGSVSAENYTSFNLASQFRGLAVLYHENRPLYDKTIQSFHDGNNRLFNKLKPNIQNAIERAEAGDGGGWDTIPTGLFDDYST